MNGYTWFILYELLGLALAVYLLRNDYRKNRLTDGRISDILIACLFLWPLIVVGDALIWSWEGLKKLVYTLVKWKNNGGL